MMTDTPRTECQHDFRTPVGRGQPIKSEDGRGATSGLNLRCVSCLHVQRFVMAARIALRLEALLIESANRGLEATYFHDPDGDREPKVWWEHSADGSWDLVLPTPPNATLGESTTWTPGTGTGPLDRRPWTLIGADGEEFKGSQTATMTVDAVLDVVGRKKLVTQGGIA